MIRYLAVPILLLLAAQTQAATTFTNSYSTFTTLAGIPLHVILFNDIAFDDQNVNGYTRSGVTFNGTSSYLYGRTYSGGFIYGPQGPGYITVTFATPVTAFGFDYGVSYGTPLGGAFDTDITLSNGDTNTFAYGTSFIGMVSSTPFTSVQVKVQNGAATGTYNLTSDYPVLFNAYTPIPEPAGLSAAGMAAFTAVLLLRRRKRHSNG